MKIKNQQDFWSGVLYIVVGLGFSVGATNYSFGSAARPGPGYFPFGLGLLLAIIGAMVLVGSLASKHEGPIGKIAWKPLSIIVGSIILFAFTLPHLGMAIALPLLVLTSALAGDEFHLGEVLLNAAILTIGSWAVFIYGLNLVIPLWPTFIG
ncbi:tripartite tricarboxylate transporter TctB family protein [Piscinibacter sakaiensis]|uniref:tripartite tricarboxylate transporter TctB family protein n=1 Tax=Piscinibacter sakaiensis TaxID=1547922 RepID=UPI003AAE2E63